MKRFTLFPLVLSGFAFGDSELHRALELSGI